MSMFLGQRQHLALQRFTQYVSVRRNRISTLSVFEMVCALKIFIQGNGIFGLRVTIVCFLHIQRLAGLLTRRSIPGFGICTFANLGLCFGLHHSLLIANTGHFSSHFVDDAGIQKLAQVEPGLLSVHEHPTLKDSGPGAVNPDIVLVVNTVK